MFVVFYDSCWEDNWWGFNEFSLCCLLDTDLKVLLPHLNPLAILSSPASVYCDFKLLLGKCPKNRILMCKFEVLRHDVSPFKDRIRVCF